MAILSTNQRLINVGDSYSAGNGIDITNNIISVTGDNAPYSAGQNIYFDGENDHVINGKDWSEEINDASANAFNEASAWVAQNYANSADMTYISAMVDTKLDTSAWSSVSGDLATESYVIMSDNMTYGRATAYVENQNYANKDFVLDNISSATSGKLDSSSFASVSGDFLTTAFGISESGAWNEATNCVETNSAAWFDNQGDVEVNELVYAQSANWNEVSSKLDSTAFDTWQQGQYTNDIAGLNNLIGTKLDSSSFSDVSGTFYPTSNPSGFITGVDLSNYYQKNETSGAEELAEAFNSIPHGDEEVNDVVHTYSANGTWLIADDITGLQPKGDYYSASNISGFITSSDISNLAPISLVEETSASIVDLIPSVEGLASETYVDEQVSGKADKNEIPDTSNFITNASAEATYQPIGNYLSSNALEGYATEQWVGEQGYLTAHQSLEGLMSANLLESADGKWTAYNSIPFKAGDEFPASADEAIQAYQTNSSTYLTAHQSLDGLMSASLLGFNAENHISSYNGSAFEDSSPTLPMTGRDGVDVQMDNGTLVLSSTLYETVTTNSAIWSQNDGDAEVNAYVHDNSATINDVVSTYQGASGTYYTTAEANTLSSILSGAIDDKLDTDVFTAWSANQFANDYQLSAGNGIKLIDDDINKITRIDVTAGGGTGGDMYTAYLEYNDQNQISGYAGSAFAGQGGGGNPEVESYVQTNSANIDETVTSYQTNSGTFLTAHQAISAEEWNDCYDNVNTNSGVWGGSALPISAGPGIKVNLVNNTLVFSNDETLLWSGNGTNIDSFTVSEPLTNFEEVSFYVTPSLGDDVVVSKIVVPMVGSNKGLLRFTFNTTWNGFTGINFTYKYSNTGMSAFSVNNASWFGYNANGATTGNFNGLYGYKIIGINRKQ